MTRPLTPRPGRRTLLATVSLTMVASVTGCDIRLQKGAPRLPGIATQGPPADQPGLLRALTAVRARQAEAASADGVWAPRLAPVYGAAVDRLTQVVASDGITVPTTSQLVPSARISAAQFGALQREGLNPAAYADTVGADAADRAMLAALLVLDAAGATVQGAAPDWSGQKLSATVAAALLPSVRAAVYGLEIIVARTPAANRPLASASLVTMDAARSRLEPAAGSMAPAPRLVYPLSVQPTTQASRAVLARDLLTGVVTACASRLRAAPMTAGDLGALVHTWSDATALGWRWGVLPVPFPGLIG